MIDREKIFPSFFGRHLVNVAVPNEVRQPTAQRIEDPYPRQLHLHSAERENESARTWNAQLPAI
jgi:hypothetical protein